MPFLQAVRAAALPLLPWLLTGCSTLGFGDDADPEQPASEPTVQISIEGLDERQQRNALAYLGLAKESCGAPEWRVRRRFAAADDDIARGLKALGHYQPTVRKSLERGEDCWRASFTVDPGPRVQVAEVAVTLGGEAAQDPAFAALLEDLPLVEGEPLDHGRYESTKRRLASLASSRGYLEARLTRSELRVDPRAGTARAVLHLESGPRYRLGALRVGDTGLDEELVRRIVEHTPGEPYSADRLHGINQALADSGYFADVDVRPVVDEAAQGSVPVTVEATPRKRHLYSAGAGFATDTGPRVRLGYENRRINRRGHRLEARLRASLVQSDLTAEYRVPLRRPQSEWLTFSAAAMREDTDSFTSNTARIGARSTHLRGRWLETRFLELSRDDFEVGRTEDTSTFLTPGLAYSRTESDGKLRPDRGWRLFAEVRAGAEGLLSETNVVRARLAAGWLRALPGGGRILTRAELGALASGDFDALPPSLRFFTGGDNSVRGYEFDSLGPRDAGGEVIGGRFLGVASIEYEHPITGAWSGAIFADAGNAFDDEFDQDVKIGLGAGVRWQSPIGPLRLDLAHPLDDDTDTLLRLHLRLGPDL